MKRVAYLLAMVFTPLLAIGCDSQAPPVTEVAVQPDLAPPVAKGSKAAVKKKKQPGIHSPSSSTTPKNRF
jgi:hypothetical protein